MHKYARENRDAYYKLAKEAGYRARSAYKLLQIDEHLGVLRGARNAVDLCAAPGSWSQVLATRLGPEAVIAAVDLAPMAPIAPNVHLLQGDITTQETADRVIALFGACRADLVVCDGAPDVTGIHDLDEFVQSELIQAALLISHRVLRRGGSFVCKVFLGQLTETVLLEKAAYLFERVQLVKPASSRSGSMEAFLCGQGFCGETPNATQGEIVQGVARCGEEGAGR